MDPTSSTRNGPRKMVANLELVFLSADGGKYIRTLDPTLMVGVCRSKLNLVLNCATVPLNFVVEMVR